MSVTLVNKQLKDCSEHSECRKVKTHSPVGASPLKGCCDLSCPADGTLSPSYCQQQLLS